MSKNNAKEQLDALRIEQQKMLDEHSFESSLRLTFDVKKFKGGRTYLSSPIPSRKSFLRRIAVSIKALKKKLG